MENNEEIVIFDRISKTELYKRLEEQLKMV